MNIWTVKVVLKYLSFDITTTNRERFANRRYEGPRSDGISEFLWDVVNTRVTTNMTLEKLG